jgi:hypothetical protein
LFAAASRNTQKNVMIVIEKGKKQFVLLKCNVRGIQMVFKIMAIPRTKNLKHGNAASKTCLNIPD